jgi:hypothetical protein
VRRIIGYAAWHGGRTVHRLLRVVLAVALAAVVAGGALAWRLAQGPLEIGWLTRRLEAAVNTDGAPPVLVIGSAALAWEGFTQGVDRPFDIRLTGVALLDGNGLPIAEVPRAEVSLSVGWLMLGRIVPRALELDGVRLRGQRGENGRVAIDLGRLAEDATGSAPDTPGVLATLLGELARPAETDSSARRSPWVQLSRLRIRDAALTMDDRQLGATWRASQVGLDAIRGPQGGAEAEGELTLALGDESLHVTASASLPAGGDSAAVEAHLTPVTPARLAVLAPGLAALRVLDAPVTLSATANVGADLVPAQMKLAARVGAGRLLLGAGSVPVMGGLAEVEGSLTAAVLTVQRLEVAPRPDGPRSVLRGSVRASHADGRLDATITGDLDQVAFADLPALWPAGLGDSGLRPWITENITDGRARNGHIVLALTAPDDLSDATVTSVSGGLDGQDLTVHWLRPVPPLEHGNARLTVDSPDALEIAVTSGRQAGGTQGGIAVQSGHLLITGLTEHDQYMTIDADLAGPAADLLTVLKHPRLRLLSRRPLNIRDATGNVAGKLTITRLFLDHRVTVDDIHIQTAGKAASLHLGGIVAGRDVDDGALDFEANNDGMKVTGTARLAGIAAQVQAELDFRDGRGTQVIQKVSVTGSATGSQLAAAGLDSAGVLDGPAALRVTQQTRRDGHGEVTVRGDLGQAALVLPWLNFSKSAGQPASGEMHVVLDHDQITAIDGVRIDGEGIAVAGRVAFAGGSPQSVHFDRLRLGDATDASGDLRFPDRPGAPWVATLAGHSIDASDQFGHGDKAAKQSADEEEQAGPPWWVEAHFDRVVLGGAGRVLTTVAATGESDGHSIRRGRLTGHTGAGSVFDIDITPGRSARTLTATTEDAGGLLYAFNLVDDMRGGRLTVHGTYDDGAPGRPLQGTAEIADFRMRNTPALAKLLQAMTLYGLVEVLQGPGLGFNRLIAPFRLAHHVLDVADARAFSASLGMTAKGQVDLARDTVAIEGTIVPAYFFNTLLGNIPLIGRLFSPERGGGLFAATYSMRGALDDPTVAVNPLAALTPGFLRGVFGIFDTPSGGGVASPSGGGARN